MCPNSSTRTGATLPVLILTGVLVGGIPACTPPVSTDPVYTRLELPHLPPLQTELSASQLFSFRIITPLEKVDVFSILQTIKPAGITLRQAALPVNQLKEVQAAKQRIESAEFLAPEEANVLAFNTARLFNWDTEVARQVLVEVVKIYTNHRDREVEKWRASVEARAQQVIARAKAKQDEINRQNEALYKRIYQIKPAVNDRDLKDEGVRRFIADRLDRLKKNQRAQEEYARQAKAAHEKYLAQLKEKIEKDRQRAEKEAKMREEMLKRALTTQSLKQDHPFYLHALQSGDFILEASPGQAFPAVIYLRVEGFASLIPVPILKQTHNGRLLLSIDTDAQGHPFIRGGLDAPSGGQFDLQAPVFTIQTQADGRQQLDFLYPDGRVESFDIDQLDALSRWDEQPTRLPPRVSQLTAESLQAQHNLFAQIRYEFLPVISEMPSEQALDILQTLQQPLL